MQSVARRLLGMACAVALQQAGAQEVLSPVTVGAEKCTAQTIGAPIEPSQIGEPVSAVTLDRIQWVAAGDRNPALCLVEEIGRASCRERV